MRGKGRTPEPGASLQFLDPSHLLLLSAKKLSKKKPSPASCFASCLRAIKSKNLKKLSEMDGAERRPELLHRGWVESGGGGTLQRGHRGRRRGLEGEDSGGALEEGEDIGGGTLQRAAPALRRRRRIGTDYVGEI